MKKKRIDISSILIYVMFIAGLGIMSYPAISNYISNYQHAHTVYTYQQFVSSVDESVFDEARKDADYYNKQAAKYSAISSVVAYEEDFKGKKYEELLSVNGSDVMGIVRIPKLNIVLPIYHGTDEGVLQVGVGHLRGSSLPVGGNDTHCVLSGHTGLPSSKLFTDIDQLKEKDIFYMDVLNLHLAYEVDQVKIVLPSEVQDIGIIENGDYCTLTTCTPYGINTHRLLVRGKRIKYLELENEISDEIKIFQPIYGILIGVISYLTLYGLYSVIFRRKE